MDFILFFVILLALTEFTGLNLVVMSCSAFYFNVTGYFLECIHFKLVTGFYCIFRGMTAFSCV